MGNPLRPRQNPCKENPAPFPSSHHPHPLHLLHLHLTTISWSTWNPAILTRGIFLTTIWTSMKTSVLAKNHRQKSTKIAILLSLVHSPTRLGPPLVIHFVHNQQIHTAE